MRYLLCLILGLQLSNGANAALRVSIDPGHGGEDKGAVHAKIRESQIALKISQKLHKLLKKDPLFETQILRNSDRNVSLESRVKMGEQFKTDLFVSIHANAHPSRRARGAEFYIQNQLPMRQESLLLAHNEATASETDHRPEGDIESILWDLEKSQRILKSYQVSQYLRKNWTQKKKRMIRQGPFFVLSQNKAPAVLVEVGYLTHPRERQRLRQSGYQQELAAKIHKALRDYVKNSHKLLTESQSFSETKVK